MFWKRQRFITLWIVVRTLRDVPPVEIRGFVPENLIGIFKTAESAHRFIKGYKGEYGYMQAYPLIIEK